MSRNRLHYGHTHTYTYVWQRERAREIQTVSKTTHRTTPNCLAIYRSPSDVFTFSFHFFLSFSSSSSRYIDVRCTGHIIFMAFICILLRYSVAFFIFRYSDISRAVLFSFFVKQLKTMGISRWIFVSLQNYSSNGAEFSTCIWNIRMFKRYWTMLKWTETESTKHQSTHQPNSSEKGRMAARKMREKRIIKRIPIFFYFMFSEPNISINHPLLPHTKHFFPSFLRSIVCPMLNNYFLREIQ